MILTKEVLKHEYNEIIKEALNDQYLKASINTRLKKLIQLKELYKDSKKLFRTEKTMCKRINEFLTDLFESYPSNIEPTEANKSKIVSFYQDILK